MADEIVLAGAAEPSLAELKIMLNPGTETGSAEAPTPKPATPESPAEIPSSGGEEPPAGSKGTEAEPGTAPESQKEPEPEAPVEIPRKPSGLEKRFSKLTRERDGATQRAEAAEARLRELEAAKAPPAEPAKPAASTAAVAGEPVPPDPTAWKGTWEELEAAKIKYSRDIAAFVTKQAREELRAELQRETQAGEGQRAAQQLQDSWRAKTEVATKAIPEFQEAVNEVGTHLDRLGMNDLVMESEVGPELVVELYEKPEEMQRLLAAERQGNPFKVSNILGQIEERLMAAKAAAAKPPTKLPVPAPKPLPHPPATPGGGGHASTLPLEEKSITELRKLLRK